METPYSKQDEAIEIGARALREQAIDTSRMATVLNPAPRRSVVLPVGLATAAACVMGAVVLMTPTKADAGQFDKVVQAVKGQAAVFERVMKPGKKGDVWEVRWETWKDGSKSGVKMPAKGGTYEVVLDGKNIYEKNPKQEHFKVELAKPITVEGGKIELDTKERLAEIQLDDTIEIKLIDAELVLADHEPKTINEILARDGMEFLGVQRGQKKENRVCDIYRVKVGKDANETLYYVDSKTDLPFLKEEIDHNGMVLRRVEIMFPGEIKLEIKLTDKKNVIEVAPVISKVKGTVKLDQMKVQDVVELRLVEGKMITDTKTPPPVPDKP